MKSKTKTKKQFNEVTVLLTRLKVPNGLDYTLDEYVTEWDAVCEHAGWTPDEVLQTLIKKNG